MTDACTHARTFGRTTLLALACAAQITACGGSDTDVVVAAAAPAPAQGASPTTAQLPESLWGAEGRAKATLPEDRPADTASKWSKQRYATRAQLAAEEVIASPYTLVIDADSEAAIESGLQLAEAVHTFAGGKELLGVFVRSRQPALAARLAERLTHEQGWANVFVVI